MGAARAEQEASRAVYEFSTSPSVVAPKATKAMFIISLLVIVLCEPFGENEGFVTRLIEQEGTVLHASVR